MNTYSLTIQTKTGPMHTSRPISIFEMGRLIRRICDELSTDISEFIQSITLVVRTDVDSESQIKECHLTDLDQIVDYITQEEAAGLSALTTGKLFLYSVSYDSQVVKRDIEFQNLYQVLSKYLENPSFNPDMFTVSMYYPTGTPRKLASSAKKLMKEFEVYSYINTPVDCFVYMSTPTIPTPEGHAVLGANTEDKQHPTAQVERSEEFQYLLKYFIRSELQAAQTALDAGDVQAVRVHIAAIANILGADK